MEVYRIENLNFSYPMEEREVLKNINLKIHSGDFITLCGKSGSGKSTLIRQLKPILTPHGKSSGKIYYKGSLLKEIDQRTESSEIGFVLQSPDNQIVL